MEKTLVNQLVNWPVLIPNKILNLSCIVTLTDEANTFHYESIVDFVIGNAVQGPIL